MSSTVHHTEESIVTFEALSDNSKEWLVVKGVRDMASEDFLVVHEISSTGERTGKTLTKLITKVHGRAPSLYGAVSLSSESYGLGKESE